VLLLGDDLVRQESAQRLLEKVAELPPADLEVARQGKREVEQPIVEVFSNDKRLADLAAWDPSRDPAS
jgi:hypothetical protein